MQQTHNDGIRLLVVSTAVFFAGITGFIIYFIVLYRNKQIKNAKEQEQIQFRFSQELLKAQIEIQEQTLSHISSEIHDNITQVLFFIKLNLKMVIPESETNRKKIEESHELIGQTINDLRNLSKSLSFEHITNLGLKRALEIELERVNNSGVIGAALGVEGECYSLGVQRELVLFRICQEGLNNTLKHSGANHFKINLQYHQELFNLTVEDDGSGFLVDKAVQNTGLGLSNIKNRASLIGAEANIDSSPGHGCVIKVTINHMNS